jgi:hypothetical protein
MLDGLLFGNQIETHLFEAFIDFERSQGNRIDCSHVEMIISTRWWTAKKVTFLLDEEKQNDLS